MDTLEIQQYIDAAINANFDNFTSESDEMMTSDGGDGPVSYTHLTLPTTPYV